MADTEFCCNKLSFNFWAKNFAGNQLKQMMSFFFVIILRSIQFIQAETKMLSDTCSSLFLPFQTHNYNVSWVTELRNNIIKPRVPTLYTAPEHIILNAPPSM